MKYSRRKFLATGGMTASGILLGASALPFNLKKSANDTIQVGIIGTGDRGTGLAHLIKETAGLKVTACCDIIPFRLEGGLQKAEKGAIAYTEYRKLLENKDIDAVIISTPFSMHAQMATDAIDAGKHVYCEKTMVRGIEEAKKLVKKAHSSKKIFQTGHQYHSSRLYNHVAGLIAKGYIGEIASFECQWNRNGNWRRPVPDQKWEKMINWRMYREYSGGLAAELCSHQIDFINWILDSHPQKIAGFGGIDYWKDGRETYDNIHLLMEYPNDVNAKFTCLTSNAFDDYKIKVLGSKGTIILDYTKAWIYAENLKEKEKAIVDGVSGATKVAWEKGEGVPIKIEHKDPTLQALLDFQDCILDNKNPESNVKSGAKVAIAIQMALDAMDNNRIEYWKDDYNF